MSQSLTYRPRGSVLIFAIVLLAILAMLGTAFLLSVRQSGKASTNILTELSATFGTICYASGRSMLACNSISSSYCFTILRKRSSICACC